MTTQSNKISHITSTVKVILLRLHPNLLEDDLVPAAKLLDLCDDSLDVLELIMELEEEFNINIPIVNNNTNTLNDLYYYLLTHTEAGDDL